MPIGIGIIGGGRVSGGHAKAILALPQTMLAGVAEPDPERRAKAAENFGCAVFPDAQSLLAAPDVEAVVIALPHALHRNAAVAALQAGKHVLIEKPLAMTVEECDEVVEAARTAIKTLMVGHHHHFVPINLEARRLIRDGEIGNIALATDTWYKPFHDGVRPAWFLDSAQGGGMWPMNGPHMIDRLMFFLDSRVTAVKACVGSPIFGFSATDMAMAFLQFESGVCATIMHAGFRDGVNRFESEITGTEGQLRVTMRQLCQSREGQWEEAEVPLPVVAREYGAGMQFPHFVLEMDEFARSIEEGREPSVSGDYGREIVRVLAACEESSETGREVRLD